MHSNVNINDDIFKKSFLSRFAQLLPHYIILPVLHGITSLCCVSLQPLKQGASLY